MYIIVKNLAASASIAFGLGLAMVAPSPARAAVLHDTVVHDQGPASDGHRTPLSMSDGLRGSVAGASTRDVGAQAFPSFPVQGIRQAFVAGVPVRDVGAQAYPSSAALGDAASTKVVNHVTRDAVPAYQHGFDTGSNAYPSVR